MVQPPMNLFDYQAELDAGRVLAALNEKLENKIACAATFDAAATACETLCQIAQTPDHYLGLELIRVLDNPHLHTGKDISTMILTFMMNIHSIIEYQRSVAKVESSMARG